MSKMMTCQVLMIDRDENAIDGLRSPWGPWANAFQAVLNQLLLEKLQENEIFTS